ncbi:MAG TPA: (deoxy)nucleoside triphosphate pyrophosphohydrolase [Vicinamibacterales bacterium]
MFPKPTLIVVAAVVERDGAYLVARRQSGVHLEGYWEFPGGKCQPGESEVDSLRREIREELDVDIQGADKLLTTVHEYDDRTVELHFYRCALEGTPRPMLGQELRWVTRDRLRELQFPPADAQLIEQLSPEGA